MLDIPINKQQFTSEKITSLESTDMQAFVISHQIYHDMNRETSMPFSCSYKSQITLRIKRWVEDVITVKQS